MPIVGKILTLIFGLLTLAGFVASLALIPSVGLKAIFSAVVCAMILAGFSFFVWKDWFLKK